MNDDEPKSYDGHTFSRYPEGIRPDLIRTRNIELTMGQPQDVETAMWIRARALFEKVSDEYDRGKKEGYSDIRAMSQEWCIEQICRFAIGWRDFPVDSD